MELDKRIKDRTGIQTCISFDKKYIGKKGFFFDEFCQLIDLKAKCCYGTLIDINETDVANDLCFKATSDKTGYNCFFRFFIPEDHLKPVEKKYRPYSLKEFIGDVNLGLEPWITMRPVGTNKECKFLYTGYQKTEVGEYICLGCFQFDFISLFKNYEIYINGEWQPFGVIEE